MKFKLGRKRAKMSGTLLEGPVGSIWLRATYASPKQLVLHVNNYDILYCLQRHM